MSPNRSSDVLTPRQLAFLADRLPEPHLSKGPTTIFEPAASPRDPTSAPFRVSLARPRQARLPLGCHPLTSTALLVSQGIQRNIGAPGQGDLR
jgi:hypothetical protein